VRIDRRAALDLLPGQVHAQDFSGLLDVANRMRREDHLTPWQPGTRIRDQIANRPVLILKIEVFDVADVAISRTELVSVQLSNTSQHSWHSWILRFTVIAASCNGRLPSYE
jgi:hypothetical protein